MKAELLDRKYREAAIEYSYKLEELVKRYLKSLFRKDTFLYGKQNALTFQATTYTEINAKIKKEFVRNLIELKSEHIGTERSGN